MRLIPIATLLAFGAALSACDEAALQAMGGGDTFPTQADLASYDTAVASIGCQMETEADYLPVEFQTGLTREQVLQITSRKLSRDEAVRLDSGGVRLTTGPCTPAVTPPAAETPTAA
ncbi:hypothetical protein [Roseivivax isoporae]|uniref:NADH dehydrogenase n=1 Tax=Roseivivax isoporae LMG 25204 TaxID=1449351 RepID=X7F9U5_9RHOB|nr:hypothetical protein [Roseivivax isoporae]ETX29473.1 hypothetical protein RISW2_23340 [Roseivivax isoporae LMG 25204]